MASRPIQILIVATHPADTFDMAGGTLSHHAAQGDKVTAIIATTGVRSHHWELAEKKRIEGASLDVEKFVEQAAAEKLEEVRNACRIMGYDDVRDLGFEDDDILVTQDKIEAIAEVIREVRPDILISHHPYESGGLKMHGTIGQATIYAWQVAAGTGPWSATSPRRALHLLHESDGVHGQQQPGIRLDGTRRSLRRYHRCH